MKGAGPAGQAAEGQDEEHTVLRRSEITQERSSGVNKNTAEPQAAQATPLKRRGGFFRKKSGEKSLWIWGKFGRNSQFNF